MWQSNLALSGGVLLILAGCQAVVATAEAIDRAKYRIPASNPVTSGQPVSAGYTESTDTTCDHTYVTPGWRVRVDGDKLCFDERLITTTTPLESPPGPSGGLRVLTSDAGSTPTFDLTSEAPKPVARCVGAGGEVIVWAEEKSGCVANGGILTAESTFVAMQWKGLGAPKGEVLGWKF